MQHSPALRYELPGTQMEDEAKYPFVKVVQVARYKALIQSEFQHCTSHSELSDVGSAHEQL